MRRRVTAAVIAALFAIGGTVPAHAETATAPTRNCAILINQQGDVLRTSCSSVSAVRAQAGLNAAATPLMTWWEDAGYKGDHHTTIYGNAGTCDTAGYSVNVTGYWANHLSSITGHGQCNIVRLTTIAGDAVTNWNLPASFGSRIWNDNVGHIQVFHR